MGYKVADVEILNQITKNINYEIEYGTKSKSQIAKDLGITTGALSHFLSGSAFPNLVTLKKLCESIGCSADTILDIKLK